MLLSSIRIWSEKCRDALVIESDVFFCFDVERTVFIGIFQLKLCLVQKGPFCDVSMDQFSFRVKQDKILKYTFKNQFANQAVFFPERR